MKRDSEDISSALAAIRQGSPLILVLVGVVLVLLPRSVVPGQSDALVVIARSLGFAITILTTSVLMMQYLRYGTITPTSRDVRERLYQVRKNRARFESSPALDRVNDLSAKVANIASLLESQPQATLEGEALEKATEGIRLQLQTYLSDEVLAALDAKYSQSRKADRIVIAIANYFSSNSARLQGELESLSSRGNLNLMIGCVMGLIGMIVLGYTALFPPPDIKTIPEVLRYYVPRVTLALLVQVFSYFFLRLYRSSLNDIKYFQNEITTVDCRANALLAGVLQGDQEAIRAVLLALAKTERNFILKRGETTVELEKARAEAAQWEAMTDVLKTAVQRAK